MSCDTDIYYYECPFVLSERDRITLKVSFYHQTPDLIKSI